MLYETFNPIGNYQLASFARLRMWMRSSLWRKPNPTYANPTKLTPQEVTLGCAIDYRANLTQPNLT
jgi:hypothetical protein